MRWLPRGPLAPTQDRKFDPPFFSPQWDVRILKQRKENDRRQLGNNCKH